MRDMIFEFKAKTIMSETLNRYRNSIPRKAVEEMVSKIIREAFEHYKED